MEPWTAKAGRDAAVAYCISEIRFYSGVFVHNHKRWMFWQTVAVVFGVVGTIVSALPDADGIPAWARAIPVALASIATGIMGSFAYRADSVRQGATGDMLQGELAKFLAGATPYDDASEPKNVSQFMGAVRAVISSEQGSWQAQASTTPTSPPSK